MEKITVQKIESRISKKTNRPYYILTSETNKEYILYSSVVASKLKERDIVDIEIQENEFGAPRIILLIKDGITLFAKSTTNAYVNKQSSAMSNDPKRIESILRQVTMKIAGNFMAHQMNNLESQEINQVARKIIALSELLFIYLKSKE